MAKIEACFMVLGSADLIAMLNRAAAGEDPGLILLEWYANAVTKNIGGIDISGK